jgi:hypothetical protein
MDIGGLASLCYEAQQGNVMYSDHFGIRALQREQPNQSEIIEALCDDDPQIIEPYPHDELGRCCLIRAILQNGRVLHICSGYPPNNRIKTVYWPDLRPDEWDSDFRVRQR